MTLLPPDVAAGLPAMGSDPWTPLRDTLIRVRLYDPASRWEWLVLEFDGQESFFGVALSGSTAVAGVFRLSELEALVAEDGSPAIRLDPDFVPLTVGRLAETNPAVEQLLAEPNPRERQRESGLVQLE